MAGVVVVAEGVGVVVRMESLETKAAGVKHAAKSFVEIASRRFHPCFACHHLQYYYSTSDNNNIILYLM